MTWFALPGARHPRPVRRDGQVGVVVADIEAPKEVPLAVKEIDVIVAGPCCHPPDPRFQLFQPGSGSSYLAAKFVWLEQ